MKMLRSAQSPMRPGQTIRNRNRCVLGALAVMGILASGPVRAEDPGFPAPQGDSGILPAGARLDRVFDGGCMLTEGVAAGPDGMVYFSDITFTRFCKDPSGKFVQAGDILENYPKNQKGANF